ncbi:hypothetical protein [Nonomuraea sp. NPDC052265]|uniref:hypothetical protein n=1 Tax=Nonomuraea sp. NPDC052265 TaxID=3364374 RepID=UPI0037CC0E0D
MIVTAGLPVIGNGLGIAEADLDRVLTACALAFGGLPLVGGHAGGLPAPPCPRSFVKC